MRHPRTWRHMMAAALGLALLAAPLSADCRARCLLQGCPHAFPSHADAQATSAPPAASGHDCCAPASEVSPAAPAATPCAATPGARILAPCCCSGRLLPTPAARERDDPDSKAPRRPVVVFADATLPARWRLTGSSPEALPPLASPFHDLNVLYGCFLC